VDVGEKQDEIRHKTTLPMMRALEQQVCYSILANISVKPSLATGYGIA
jgi:hypothetical protein